MFICRLTDTTEYLRQILLFHSWLSSGACQDSNLIAYVVALHPVVSASVCYGFVSGGIPEEVDDSHVTFLDIPGVIFVLKQK